MSFSLFFRGQLLALIVFAAVIYFLNGSIWTTVIETAVCAVLIQVGYFASVLFMVWRSGRPQPAETSAEKKTEPGRGGRPSETAT
ncbi:exopolysaccharide production repressor protein [Consotaella aegiceratis]|uniref:exopolysaccharide production repressor protein n=1 Tax=Consotaella aegiceratis TaxID=3097961 RepID=UPI002F3FA690